MTKTPSLLVLPEPILDESPASWMLRLCQYHQSWPNQICDSFGLGKTTDFDVQLTLDLLLKLSYGTAVSQASLSYLDSMFLHIRSCEQRQAAFLLNQSLHGYSTYRYCPKCLREDPVPHWRFPWRMAYFLVCPKHHCVMLDRCLTCNAVLEALPTMRRGFFEGADRPICRFCLACGDDLGQFHAESLSDCKRLRDVLGLQHVVTAALVHGYLSVSGVTGLFRLEDLPRILMMGASRCRACGSASWQGGLVAQSSRSDPYIRDGPLMKEEARSSQRMVVSGDYHDDEFRRSADRAWRARFFDVIDQIRRVGGVHTSCANS
jgi:hypothetical protein